MNISGVILAGGENKRFGGIVKSNIEIDGSPIISRILYVISDIFSEIIIVTNTPGEFRYLTGCKIVGDQFLKAGPLGGIHASMKSSSKDSVFIFAGDMPFLDKDIIMRQIDHFSLQTASALIPKINGKEEPLHAIYRNSLMTSLEEYLSEGKNFAVRDFLAGEKVDYFNLEESEKTIKAFTNINTPEGAKEAEIIL
jgi:molybdopterin-guanine dinucleotide biosynthesis protein A